MMHIFPQLQFIFLFLVEDEQKKLRRRIPNNEKHIQHVCNKFHRKMSVITCVYLNMFF